MAIIYTYPVKTNPVGDDLILISDSADSNKTKQIKVSTLPSSGGGSVSSVGLSLSGLAAFAITGDNPVTGSGTITLGTTGGSAGQYLDYQGNWSTPSTGTSYQAGNGISIDTTTNPDTINQGSHTALWCEGTGEASDPGCGGARGPSPAAPKPPPPSLATPLRRP